MACCRAQPKHRYLPCAVLETLSPLRVGSLWSTRRPAMGVRGDSTRRGRGLTFRKASPGTQGAPPRSAFVQPWNVKNARAVSGLPKSGSKSRRRPFRPRVLYIPSGLFAMLFLIGCSETPNNPPSKHLVDLAMARNGFRSSSLRIVVDIVAASMAKQSASCLLQFPNQVEPLHATSNSSTFLIPGIWSVVNI